MDSRHFANYATSSHPQEQLAECYVIQKWHLKLTGGNDFVSKSRFCWSWQVLEQRVLGVSRTNTEQATLADEATRYCPPFQARETSKSTPWSLLFYDHSDSKPAFHILPPSLSLRRTNLGWASGHPAVSAGDASCAILMQTVRQINSRTGLTPQHTQYPTWPWARYTTWALLGLHFLTCEPQPASRAKISQCCATTSYSHRSKWISAYGIRSYFPNYYNCWKVWSFVVLIVFSLFCNGRSFSFGP